MDAIPFKQTRCVLTQPLPNHPKPPTQAEGVFDMYVDFEGARGEERVDALMRALARECNSMLVLDKREVRWMCVCVCMYGRGRLAVALVIVSSSICIHTIHTQTKPNQTKPNNRRCPGSPGMRSSSTPSPTACWTRART